MNGLGMSNGVMTCYGCADPMPAGDIAVYCPKCREIINRGSDNDKQANTLGGNDSNKLPANTGPDKA